MAASCLQALREHPRIAEMCRRHPTLAPLIAGVADAFQAQFGTIRGAATNLLFLLLGLVMSAVSGFGLIAKIAVSLASLGLLAATLGPLIKEGWNAGRELARAKAGTPERSGALLRLGKVGGTVLILALMSAVGWGIGRSKPGQAAIGAMTSAFSKALGPPAAVQAPPPSLKDPASLAGISADQARGLIPKDWQQLPARNGLGAKFVRPGSRGADQIRIMEGNPKAPDLYHQGPRLIVSMEGRKFSVPLQGNGGQP